ncbi:S-2-hydroxy-acid oxidase [Microdochium trichocladiopsis]|uniref:Oxidase FUB9 n=1 Tax=Microdochium trichocladiopsis TaxID=1682393 RepID=A0A9P8XW68_9PEZI|nr:S-2-hydroxy-acid oxidase [Microdochium trichocladiopsis]KAH7024344.1 S-2-hydroxy-acid oxidase [Microdochium trichocladiopsis]
MTIEDLRTAATAKMSPVVSAYYNGGSMQMITLRENQAAFDRFKIRPRILTDVSVIDTTTTILGSKTSVPFGFAPSAMHCLAHPDGERATSRAAAKKRVPMALSTYSTVSLEDVRMEGSAGDNPYAFQLSIVKDRSTTLSWIKRAETAGYRALFITVDAPVLGRRLNEKSGKKFELPEHLSLPNLAPPPSADGTPTKARSYHTNGRDASVSWRSAIPWVKQNTKLEIWLKGVYTPADVQLAIQYGLNGVIISNHGGRQLDGVPATIDALAECAPVARGRIKIGIDGGIYRGTDIFKALALGADFCFLGRVPLWGLAYGGQEGVERAVDILEDELRLAMALAGCPSIKDITKDHLSVLGVNGLLCKL